MRVVSRAPEDFIGAPEGGFIGSGLFGGHGGQGFICSSGCVATPRCFEGCLGGGVRVWGAVEGGVRERGFYLVRALDILLGGCCPHCLFCLEFVVVVPLCDAGPTLLDLFTAD